MNVAWDNCHWERSIGGAVTGQDTPSIPVPRPCNAAGRVDFKQKEGESVKPEYSQRVWERVSSRKADLLYRDGVARPFHNSKKSAVLIFF